MNISDILTKFKKTVKVFIITNQREIILGIAVFLISIISFGLGRISAKLPKESPIIVRNLPSGEANSAETEQSAINAENTLKTLENNNLSLSQSNKLSASLIIASKNGAKYHYPWCPGALRIKEENKITFQSVEEAKIAGYEPAANCPGLE